MQIPISIAIGASILVVVSTSPTLAHGNGVFSRLGVDAASQFEHLFETTEHPRSAFHLKELPEYHLAADFTEDMTVSDFALTPHFWDEPCPYPWPPRCPCP